MSIKKVPNLVDYNKFCESLKEGDILYNINSTNLWGDYLLVSNITPLTIVGIKTYTVLLLGLKKEEDNYIPLDLRIKLTSDDAPSIPFLRTVGYCKFKLVPDLSTIYINKGLVSIYGSVDLWKYREKLNIKKPRRRKYDKAGNPVIKKAGNK